MRFPSFNQLHWGLTNINFPQLWQELYIILIEINFIRLLMRKKSVTFLCISGTDKLGFDGESRTVEKAKNAPGRNTNECCGWNRAHLFIAAKRLCRVRDSSSFISLVIWKTQKPPQPLVKRDARRQITQHNGRVEMGCKPTLRPTQLPSCGAQNK